METKQYVQAKEFASITGMHINTVRRKLKQGLLPARQDGGQGTKWTIDLLLYQRGFFPSSQETTQPPTVPTLSVNPTDKAPPTSCVGRPTKARRGPSPAWTQRLQNPGS